LTEGNSNEPGQAENTSLQREKRTTLTEETSNKSADETQEAHRRSDIKETTKAGFASHGAIVSCIETAPAEAVIVKNGSLECPRDQRYGEQIIN
jgi:hypothetical protein